MSNQEVSGPPEVVATDDELIGCKVMVGNRPATIIEHNKFNRPPFAFAYADGTREFGWRETFYVLPTLEQVIIHLHEHQHGTKQCVQGNCRRRDIAAQLAPAVLALLSPEETK